jgi:tRNA pseudouridine55 synthase
MGRRTNCRPDLNGLLVIDKPLGWTSAKVCWWVRRRTKGAKIGHAGTLDPLATGVLVLCLGSATKAVDRLMATRKRYLAEVDLSRVSTTDDGEGTITPVDVPTPPTREAVDRALARFVGTIKQRPPAHSAIWIDGARAYHLARAGAAPEMKEREIVIHSITIIDYAWPILRLDIDCGKGTYIRSLARDIGVALGTGGMLAGLRRTAVGEFTIERAASPETLPEAIEPGHLAEVPRAPPDAPVSGGSFGIH